MWWIIPVAIALILVIYVISAYNKLISYSARVDNGWAQIDVQLKKRFDLIPNLVETVKGYASHEKGTLEEVVRLRNAAASAKTTEEKMELDGKLSGALHGLMVTVEAYPQLKADQNFIALQQQLSDVESKIAFSRQFYNDTVMRYNEFLLKFPSNLIASMFRFGPRPYFEAEEGAATPPKVQF